jgi:hypothetical protein
MEIQAILGHTDLRNAEIYVRAANKAKLAKAAMARVYCRGMSENKRRSKKCHTWKT